MSISPITSPLTSSLLKQAITEMVVAGVPLAEAVRQFRQQYVETALTLSKNNRCAAARLIRSHRNTVGRELKRNRNA